MASNTATMSPSFTLSFYATFNFRIIPCILEVTPPSTGPLGAFTLDPISMNPVGTTLTSKSSPSTSTLYSVGIDAVFEPSTFFGISSGSSITSPLKNLNKIEQNFKLF